MASNGRLSRQQESFLVFLFDGSSPKTSGPTAAARLPYRMLMTARSLEKRALVKRSVSGWMLTEKGKTKAETFKSWQENPELRPRAGGQLKKGTITRW